MTVTGGTISLADNVASTFGADATPAGVPVTAGQVLASRPAPHDARLGGIQVNAGSAGTIGSTVVDLQKNGVSVWATGSTKKPTLAASGTGAFQLAAPDVRGVQAGDMLTFVVTQSGGHGSVSASAALENPNVFSP